MDALKKLKDSSISADEKISAICQIQYMPIDEPFVEWSIRELTANPLETPKIWEWLSEKCKTRQSPLKCAQMFLALFDRMAQHVELSFDILENVLEWAFDCFQKIQFDDSKRNQNIDYLFSLLEKISKANSSIFQLDSCKKWNISLLEDICKLCGPSEFLNRRKLFESVGGQLKLLQQLCQNSFENSVKSIIKLAIFNEEVSDQGFTSVLSALPEITPALTYQKIFFLNVKELERWFIVLICRWYLDMRRRNNNRLKENFLFIRYFCMLMDRKAVDGVVMVRDILKLALDRQVFVYSAEEGKNLYKEYVIELFADSVKALKDCNDVHFKLELLRLIKLTIDIDPNILTQCDMQSFISKIAFETSATDEISTEISKIMSDCIHLFSSTGRINEFFELLVASVSEQHDLITSDKRISFLLPPFLHRLETCLINTTPNIANECLKCILDSIGFSLDFNSPKKAKTDLSSDQTVSLVLLAAWFIRSCPNSIVEHLECKDVNLLIEHSNIKNYPELNQKMKLYWNTELIEDSKPENEENVISNIRKIRFNSSDLTKRRDIKNILNYCRNTPSYKVWKELMKTWTGFWIHCRDNHMLDDLIKAICIAYSNNKTYFWISKLLQNVEFHEMMTQSSDSFLLDFIKRVSKSIDAEYLSRFLIDIRRIAYLYCGKLDKCILAYLKISTKHNIWNDSVLAHEYLKSLLTLLHISNDLSKIGSSIYEILLSMPDIKEDSIGQLFLLVCEKVSGNFCDDSKLESIQEFTWNSLGRFIMAFKTNSKSIIDECIDVVKHAVMNNQESILGDYCVKICGKYVQENSPASLLQIVNEMCVDNLEINQVQLRRWCIIVCYSSSSVHDKELCHKLLKVLAKTDDILSEHLYKWICKNISVSAISDAIMEAIRSESNIQNISSLLKMANILMEKEWSNLPEDFENILSQIMAAKDDNTKDRAIYQYARLLLKNIIHNLSSFEFAQFVNALTQVDSMKEHIRNRHEWTDITGKILEVLCQIIYFTMKTSKSGQTLSLVVLELESIMYLFRSKKSDSNSALGVDQADWYQRCLISLTHPKVRRGTKKHAHHLLISYTYIQKSMTPIAKEFSQTIFEGVCAIMDICDDKDLEFISNCLDSSSKDTFKQIHNRYKLFSK